MKEKYEEETIVLKEHENLTKSMTPSRHHHPISWYVKWISSCILVLGMIATTNNLYPYNMVLQFIGCFGWLWVAIIWNDRALIVINAIAVAIFINGFVMFFKG